MITQIARMFGIIAKLMQKKDFVRGKMDHIIVPIAGNHAKSASLALPQEAGHPDRAPPLPLSATLVVTLVSGLRSRGGT
jgi:hypothetical protein